MKFLPVVAIFAIGMLYWTACSKDENKPQDPVYSIDSLRDQSLRRVSQIEFSATVLADGYPENAGTVALSVEGLPVGVIASVNPPAGTAGLVSKVKIFAGLNSALGTYPLKLVGAVDSATVAERSFNLTIRSEDCALDFVGAARDGSRLCASPGTLNFTSDIHPGPYAGQLRISNFAGLSVEAILDLNCDRGVVTIAPKTYNNSFSLSGQGTFNGDAMKLRVFYSDTSMRKDTCTVRYNR